MIKPLEMSLDLPVAFTDGAATTSEVWDTFTACIAGDLPRVQQLVSVNPLLARCKYDYTSPLHFAVRDGRVDVARYLIARGALDPNYKTHPFLEPLTEVAADRDDREMSDLLADSLANLAAPAPHDDTGKIQFKRTTEHAQFQEAVDKGRHDAVEAMLKANADLARDGLAFWGEGILAMPAKDGDHHMVDLLLDHGAAVPDVSKWGARYYF